MVCYNFLVLKVYHYFSNTFFTGVSEDIKKLVDRVNKKSWGWMNDTY